jgi:HK97 family phage portal protein
MGILDILRRKEAPTSSAYSDFFSGILGRIAPDAYSRNRLAAYKNWVFACTNAIAYEIANADIQLHKKTKEGWERISEHPALEFLSKANPQQSGSELMFSTAAYLELDGNSPWYIVRGKATGRPIEAWPLDPTRVSTVTSGGRLIGYKVLGENGVEVPLKPEEVIFHKTFNPKSLFRGIGTVEAAAKAINTDNYAADYNANFFYNAATPSATLETDQKLSTETFKRLEKQWRDKFVGSGNAHKLAILEAGLKFNPISPSQRDMEFLEQRRYSRDEILAIFRVPKSIIGIVEDVNRANAEATEYIFARYVVKPKLDLIVGKLNEFLLPMYGLKQTDYKFIATNVVPRNAEYELRRKETGVRNGWYTINEVRAEEGKKPLKNGDVPYLPLNLAPMDFGSDPAPKEGDTNKSVEAVHVCTPECKHESTEGFLKAIKKELVVKDQVEKRVRYITNEIKSSRPEYEELLKKHSKKIVMRMKSQKKSYYPKTKATKEEIISILFEGLESGWIDDFKEKNKALYDRVMLYAGKVALASVDVNMNFDLKHPRAIEWARVHALEHATSVVGTIKEQVRTRVIDGIDNGLGSDEIARNLSEFFDSQSKWRAERIARTEVISSYGEGSLEGYRQSGRVKMKRWLTANDDRVDDECLANQDDGPIGLSASFSSGHAAPPVHPNCRCTLIPEVEA